MDWKLVEPAGYGLNVFILLCLKISGKLELKRQDGHWDTRDGAIFCSNVSNVLFTMFNSRCYFTPDFSAQIYGTSSGWTVTLPMLASPIKALMTR